MSISLSGVLSGARNGTRARALPARSEKPVSAWRAQLTPGRITALVLGVLAIGYARLGPILPGLEDAVTSMFQATNDTAAAAPESLVVAAQTLLGIFVFFVLCLATEALPALIVGLCSPMLLVVLVDLPVSPGSGDEIPVAFNAFASDTFFLILGAFVLVAVMIQTGLGKRIAFAIVASVRSTRADRIMAALMGAGATLHAILPTVAETAMFLPISRCLGEISEGREKPPGLDRANQGMILAVAGLVPLLGGMLFLTAGVPNLVLKGTLAGQGIHISWLDWLWWNLPLWGLLPLAYFMVKRRFGMGAVDLPNVTTVMPRMRAELGPISRGETWTLSCIAIAFVLWTTEPLTGIPTGMATLLMVGLLFLPGMGLELKDYVGHVMWGMVFLIGGAISLGNLLYKFGVVTWAAEGLVSPIKSWGITSSILVMLIAVAGLHVARAGILSGGAMAAVFVPLSIGLANAFDFNTLPFSVIIVNCLNVAVFVPVSAVAILVATQAARISWREILVFGGTFSILGNLYIVLALSGWFALIGMPVQ